MQAQRKIGRAARAEPPPSLGQNCSQVQIVTAHTDAKCATGVSKGGVFLRGSAELSAPLAGFFWYFSCRGKKSTFTSYMQQKAPDYRKPLSSIYLFFVHWNFAIVFFKFPDAILRQKFQLSVQRSFILLGDICDFIEQFRIKSDSSLDLIGRHDNTSPAI